MLPISSGDVLISASVSRNTRKQPAAAHAQLTDGTFAACLCPVRSALPKGDTGCGRNAPEDAAPLHSVPVESGPGAVACPGAVPALCPGAPLPPARARRCRFNAGGPGAGKAAALPGDGGVAAGSAGPRWLLPAGRQR